MARGAPHCLATWGALFSFHDFMCYLSWSSPAWNAIPIYWEDLERKGNSQLADRKDIIRKARRHFNISEKILLADREYIGEEWFVFLLDHDLDFVIRLRKKNYRKAVDQAPGKSYTALEKKVLRSKVRTKTVGKTVIIGDKPLSFVLAKQTDPQADEPLLFLLSSLEETPAKIASRYPIRWKIEHCFRQLKSNGFHLEEVNLQGKARVNLLIAVVVFAYTLSVVEGLKDYHRVPMKTYADGTVTKSNSVFRHGIVRVNAICDNFKNLCLYVLQQVMALKYKYRHSRTINV